MMEFFRRNTKAIFPLLMFVVFGFVFMGTQGGLDFSFSSKTLFMIDGKEISGSDVQEFEKNFMLMNYRNASNDAFNIRDRENLLASMDENATDQKTKDERQNLQESIDQISRRLQRASIGMALHEAQLDDGIYVSDQNSLDFLRENWYLKGEYLRGNFAEGFLSQLPEKREDITSGKTIDKSTEKKLRTVGNFLGDELQRNLHTSCFTMPVSLSYTGHNFVEGYYPTTIEAKAEMIKISIDNCKRTKTVSYDDAAIGDFYRDYSNRKKDEDNPYGYLKPGSIDITYIYAVSEDFTSEVSKPNPTIIRAHYDRYRSEKWMEKEVKNKKLKEGEEKPEPKAIPFYKVKTEVEKDYLLQQAGEKADIILRKALLDWTKRKLSPEQIVAKYKYLEMNTVKGIENTDSVLDKVQLIPGAKDELKAAFSMNAGEISKKINHSHKGPFIYRLDKLVPDAPKPLEEVKEQVKLDMADAQPEKDAREILEAFRSSYNAKSDTPDSKAAIEALVKKANALLEIDNFKAPEIVNLGKINLETKAENIKALEGLDADGTLSQLIRSISKDFGRASIIAESEDKKIIYVIFSPEHKILNKLEGDKSFSKKWEESLDMLHRVILRQYSTSYHNQVIQEKVTGRYWGNPQSNPRTFQR